MVATIVQLVFIKPRIATDVGAGSGYSRKGGILRFAWVGEYKDHGIIPANLNATAVTQ